ncbi:MAG: hypothetical protein WC460_00350 [Patescibacteria group bacterium]
MIFLGIDWGKIFSVPFWLDVNPGELSARFEQMFLVVLAVSYLIYGLSKLMAKRLKIKREFVRAKFWVKVGNFCLTMAISFTFIFFFRYEAIPVLGGRFWIFIWLLMGVIWLVYLIRYYFVVMKKQLRELNEKQKLNKYLKK